MARKVVRNVARHDSRRLIVLLLLVALLALVLLLPSVFGRLSILTARAAAIIEQHAILGAIVFLGLSIVSAMLAFFSTAALVPVAVSAWGKLMTLALLWLGWLGGGALSYGIGRYLGRRAVVHFVEPKRLARYERMARRLAGLPQILLLQLALPSEVPGYVLGILRCRPRTYLLALAIAELPFAIGAVYLGESFLHGNVLLFVIVAVVGITVSAWAARLLRRRLERQG